MKQLVCELCGGTNLVKDGGMFICQSCGCKYSLEEARKLITEGDFESTSATRDDDSIKKQAQVDDYIKMAKSALDSNDVDGVISYCDKILDIDHDSFDAWTLRAKAIAGTSRLTDMKIPSALTAAKRAVELAPDIKKYDVAEDVYLSIKGYITGLIHLTPKVPATMGRSYAHTIIQHWLSLLLGIPFLSKSLLEAEIADCKELCDISSNTLVPKGRIVYDAWNQFNNGVRYDKSFSEALAEKMQFEGARQESFIANAKAEAEAKRAAYWAEHIDEKDALESEKSAAEEKMADLTLAIENIPELIKVEELKKSIAELTKQMNSLGMFKGKEKRVLQDQIDAFKTNLSQIESAVSEKKVSIQSQIDEQTKIIEKATAELNKDR